jgi:predicted ATPase
LGQRRKGDRQAFAGQRISQAAPGVEGHFSMLIVDQDIEMSKAREKRL